MTLSEKAIKHRAVPLMDAGMKPARVPDYLILVNNGVQVIQLLCTLLCTISDKMSDVLGDLCVSDNVHNMNSPVKLFTF